MIKPVESATPRKGLRWDPKRGKHVGYLADFRVGGKRRREYFETKKAAETYLEQVRLASKLRKAGVPAHHDPPTVEELLAARHKKIKNHAEKARARRIFDFFLTLIPKGAKVPDVRSADFTKFRNAREADGMKLETINRELNPLSKAFSSAADLFPDALEDYEPPKVRRPKFKRKRRERVVTPEEKDLILAQLYSPRTGKESDATFQNRVRIGRMFEIAWYLGMAYKEVATLKKTAYDGESLRFTRAKTGNDVTFEWLPEEVHKLLRDAIAASDTEFVFTFSGSTPRKFQHTMKKAITAAGLPYGRDAGLTFHSARHSFVSNAMRHADLKTVASMSGHSDSAMVLLYTHASPESRKRALESMYGGTDLRAIFDGVKDGSIDFEEFKKLLK